MPRDYEITVKVRNGRILSRMRELGIGTQAELAKLSGVSSGEICALLAMRKPPKLKSGEWSLSVSRIAGALKCDPEELFTDAQRQGSLKQNSASFSMDEPEFRALCAGGGVQASVEAKSAVKALLTCLNPRETHIVTERALGATLDDLADEYGIVKERVRQIEARAYRKMRAFSYRNHGIGRSEMGEA